MANAAYRTAIAGEDGTLVRRQSPEPTLELVSICDRGGCIGRSGLRPEHPKLVRPAPPVAALVGTSVDEESVEPGVEPLGISQSGKPLPCMYQRFLHCVRPPHPYCGGSDEQSRTADLRFLGQGPRTPRSPRAVQPRSSRLSPVLPHGAFPVRYEIDASDAPIGSKTGAPSNNAPRNRKAFPEICGASGRWALRPLRPGPRTAGRSSRRTTTCWCELEGSDARSATTLKPARSNIGTAHVQGWCLARHRREGIPCLGRQWDDAGRQPVLSNATIAITIARIDTQPLTERPPGALGQARRGLHVPGCSD